MNTNTTTKKHWAKAILSFLLVLFLMPLGHAFMIMMEHTLSASVLPYAAFALGAAGMLVVIAGVFVNGDTKQTLFGLFGGLLFWTGWFEFLLQYYANRYGVQPQLDPVTGEIVTKPEYLILPATFGLWMMVMMLYLFCTANGCLFFNWIQRRLFRRSKAVIAARPMTRHVSMVVFMELMMILWTSYLLLMFCYDSNFFGDSHPVTIAIGVGCFIGSLFIFRKQLRLSAWGANIRMSIATVVVLWTPVEIMGRNDLFNEIWVAPAQHQTEMITILVTFLAVCAFVIFKAKAAPGKEIA